MSVHAVHKPSTYRRLRQWPHHATRWIAALLLLVVIGCSAADVTDTPTVTSIDLTPPNASVEAGRTLALVARPTDASGTLISGRTIRWSSNNTSVATVSSAGVVTALSAGDARIAASVDGQSALATITVTDREVASVQVTPVALSVRVNRTASLQARALDADGDPLSGRSIVWSSSNPGVATISAQGVISAVAPGAATITATSEGRSGQAAVTVTPEPVASVVVAPERDTLAVNTELTMTASVRDAAGAELSDRSVSWSVSDPNIATVTSTGIVTALAPGSVSIIAVSESRVGQGTIVVLERLADAITLTPSSSTVEIGQSVQLISQVTDPSGNILTDRPVSYASDNTAVAAVSASGLVTTSAAGVARITATSEGKTAVATITVIEVPVSEVRVTPASSTLIVGGSRTLSAQARSASGTVIAGREVTWTSGAPGIATVSASGAVSAVSPGTAVIAATIDGVSGLATVTVQPRAIATVTITPAAPEISVGQQSQLTATLRDASNAILTQRVITWSSSNESVAFVSSNGLVVGVGAGSAVITATSEGVSGTTTVIVR